MDTVTIGDDATPVYKLDWGTSSRTTDELDTDDDEVNEAQVVENLVGIAREDNDCEVTLLGFE